MSASPGPTLSLAELESRFRQVCQQHLALDLTRGKPSPEQLDLSNRMDGILQGQYTSEEGVDVRNYGGLTGLIEARRIGAMIMDTPVDQVMAGGNSSLTLMYQFIAMCLGQHPGWRTRDGNAVRMLCPVPGYDRHFTVCERLGIEMITVPMTETGPDMDQVESLLRDDPSIRGIWCVPRYANPTGCTYSEETVQRMAKLADVASDGFRIVWDNAYGVHHLTDDPAPLPDLLSMAMDLGNADTVAMFASTSKITLAGAGVAFFASSPGNMGAFQHYLGGETIGPDKVNQLRHARFIPDQERLQQLMREHAAIVKPRFECALEHLGALPPPFAWTQPKGGYFILFDCGPALASDIVQLAAEAGIKLTPAGATHPHGHDPDDRFIRLAPTFPSLKEIDLAMSVFVLAVQLAAKRRG